MRYTISKTHDGKILKNFLYGYLGLSHAEVTHLKNQENGIMLNGKHATVRAYLKGGDILDIMYEDKFSDMNEKLIPVKMPLDILYEDDSLILCNKPAFVPTHPSHGHTADTLANGLAGYFGEKGIPFVFRAVNRLDSETSGVVLVAKNRPAAAEMSRRMMSGQIKKEYLAVLHGKFEDTLADTGEIIANIGRCEKSVILREVKPEGCGDFAITRYRKLIEYEIDGAVYTLVRASPVTGRTHQLRVHFAYIGHPIVGDHLYASGSNPENPEMSSFSEYDVINGRKIIERQALHALSLNFVIYRENKNIAVYAPVPEDMIKILPEGFSLEDYI